MTEVVVVRWLTAEGDHVEQGQALAEIETEKTVMELEAPATGLLARIVAQPGVTAQVAESVAWILQAGESEQALPARKTPAGVPTSALGTQSDHAGEPVAKEKLNMANSNHESSGAPDAKAAAPKRELLFQMYKTMRLIRTFEDKIHELFAAGEIPGFVHLYAGEEAVGVGVCSALRSEDIIVSNHRGHGHCIAKGTDLNRMLAEIFGRATGLCKGKGGSMHLTDPGVGLLGTNGIVGAGIPLAIGAALSAKVLKNDKVSVCFFGDATTNQGAWHEGVNMAAVLDLPCVFVCENNLYGCTTSTGYSMRAKNVAARAAAYGIPGVTVDGQNVVDVYAAVLDAVRRARAGGGPTLIEALTYRYYGHFEGDNLKYRPAGEEEPWRQRDPLKVFAEELAPPAGITPEELRAADEQAVERVQQAIEFARASPLPAPEECLTGAYETY